jgi:mycothione reductase
MTNFNKEHFEVCEIMKEYDIIIIGGGSGMDVAEFSLMHGLKVAIVHKPPIGGTCQNFGCIPSKMLIFAADRIMEIQEAGKLGVHAEVQRIDFHAIMDRMNRVRKEEQEHELVGVNQVENLDYYYGKGHFIKDYVLEVNNEKIRGKKIVISTGARPLIPPIKGIDSVDFLTNESLLDLQERPESLIIVGGGYIAVEYGHFFAAMGTKVTILEKGARLIKNSEPEISDLLKTQLEKRMNIVTNFEVKEVKKEGKNISVFGIDNNGKEQKFTGEKILIAAGRKSNADLLKVEKTGVETDQKGYIRVNEFLETSKKNIWALGDANGKHMFKHVANREASLLAQNIVHGHKARMEYHAIPYAIFSHPQIASVGITEEQAKEKYDILIGKGFYSDTAKGDAMMEQEGFAKVIIDRKTGRILGFHIIGPYAPMIIQEVINAMSSSDGTPSSLFSGLHIHPALPELILVTFQNLEAV